MNTFVMRSLTATLLFSSAIGLVGLPQGALAQEDDETAKLFASLTATGSSVPTSVDDLPNKVTLIDAKQIQASGVGTNLLDVLRKLVPSLAGRGTIGNSNARNENQKMGGGSEALLRNLDTLVLINGRRVAIDAYAGLLGGKTYVDLNQIPMAAVDRVEILADGASSIYGSDAVGGVINIILKSDYEGVEGGARYGGADKYQEKSGYAMAGKTFGNASVTVVASDSHSSPLYERERAFTSSIPLSNYRTLLLGQDQKALTANFSYDVLGDTRFVVFGDTEYVRTESVTEWQPVSSGGFTTPWPNDNEDHDRAFRGTIGIRGSIAPGWGWEAAYVHSEDSVDQDRKNLIYSHNFNALAAGGYDANGNAVAGGNYSLLYNGTSPSSGTTLVPAVSPSALTPALASSLSSRLFGTEKIRTLSYIDSYDAKFNGTIGELPAGKPAFVLGAAWREEGLNGKADPNGVNSLDGNAGPTALATVQQWIGGSFYDHYKADRTVKSYFEEVRVPITSPTWNVPGLYSLDLIGATRTEHYSEAGWSTVPRTAFMWKPLDSQLTVRGGISKAFTAPPLTQVNGPNDTRIVGSGVLSNLFPGTTNNGFHGADDTNPDLRPSKTYTRSLSLTYDPNFVPGLDLGIEYNAVKQRGAPGGHGFNVIIDSVNRLGAASPYAALAAFNAFPGQAGAVPVNAGDISACIQSAGKCGNLYVADYWSNRGGVDVKSNTFTAKYSHSFGRYGVGSFNNATTLFDSYKIQDFPYSNWYQYAGTATSTAGTLPRWHSYSNLSWQYADATATIGHSYIGAVSDIGAGGTKATAAAPVKSWQTVDLQIAYEGGPVLGEYGRRWTVALGVDNIADRMPPSAMIYATSDGAAGDASTYSPVGRLVYVQGSFKF